MVEFLLKVEQLEFLTAHSPQPEQQGNSTITSSADTVTLISNDVSIGSLSRALDCGNYIIFQRLVRWYLTQCSFSPTNLIRCHATKRQWLTFEKELLSLQIVNVGKAVFGEHQLTKAIFLSANGHPHAAIILNIAVFLLLFLLLSLIRVMIWAINLIQYLILNRRLFIFKLAVSEKLLTVPHTDQRRNSFIQAASEGFLDIVKYLREVEKVHVQV